MSDYQMIIQRPKVSELIVDTNLDMGPHEIVSGLKLSNVSIDSDLDLGTHAIKSDAAPTAGIPINHVKLPLPIGSDYIVESVTPTPETPASVTVEQSTVIQAGISNVPNIYDASDTTKASYPGSSFDGPLISWDMGLIYKSLYVSVKLGAFEVSAISRLERSSDGESWTTVETIAGGSGSELTTTFAEITNNVRYLRWYGGCPGTTRVAHLYYLRVAAVYYVATLATPTIAAGLKIAFGTSQTVTPQTSTNGTTYTNLEPRTGTTPVWTFPAQYVHSARWSATSTTTGTLSLYERLTDRVAAEHGHGSGIVDAHHTHENFGSRGVALAKTLQGSGTDLDRLMALEEAVVSLAQMID